MRRCMYLAGMLLLCGSLMTFAQSSSQTAPSSGGVTATPPTFPPDKQAGEAKTPTADATVPNANGEPASPAPASSDNPQLGATAAQNSESGASSEPNAVGAQAGSKPDGEMTNNDVQGKIENGLKGQNAMSGVKVMVMDKQVMLSGTVETASDKQSAEQMAKSFAGGRKVSNDLKVVGKQ